MSYELLFLRALVCTLAMETSALYLTVRFLFRLSQETLPTPTIISTGLICSTLTLPYVWFFFPAFLQNRTLFAFTTEAIVVIVESLLIFHLLSISPKKAIVASLICNASSVIVGKLLLS